MAQVINTNVASLNAQRNLNTSQNALSVSLQRLSTGLRINSAKDDAAGLAISTRMTTQVRGLTVAIRNANDGISVAQTAEGAMNEMVGSLQRMNELATQAASYNTSSDRTSLNQEVSQLIDELSRIVNQTKFNGQKILDGSFSGDFQVGTGVSETINVAVTNMSPTSMGVATNFSTITNLSNANLATRMAATYRNATTSATVAGTTIADVSANSNSLNKMNAINAVTSSTGVSAFGYGNALVGTDYTAAGTTAAVTNGIAAGALVINGVSIDSAASAASNTLTADNLVAAINNKTAEHGVTAVNVSDANQDTTTTESAIVLINRNGAAITVTANSATDAGITSFFADGTTSVSAGANGAIVLNDSLSDTSLTLGGNSTDALAITGVSSTSVTLAAAAVNSQTITSAASANLAMLAFTSALDNINSQRAILGAKQNRLESVVANLQNVRENISAARSRIQDADFAAETAELTRNQILQQAGVAMLAQANALPNNVLTLLRG